MSRAARLYPEVLASAFSLWSYSLQELVATKTTIEGLTPRINSPGERLREQVNRNRSRIKDCWQNLERAIAD
jgi:hypothetical protein